MLKLFQGFDKNKTGEVTKIIEILEKFLVKGII